MQHVKQLKWDIGQLKGNPKARSKIFKTKVRKIIRVLVFFARPPGQPAHLLAFLRETAICMCSPCTGHLLLIPFDKTAGVAELSVPA